jgi:hypothetical protein
MRLCQVIKPSENFSQHSLSDNFRLGTWIFSICTLNEIAGSKKLPTLFKHLAAFTVFYVPYSLICANKSVTNDTHNNHLLPSPKLYHVKEDGAIVKREGDSRMSEPSTVRVGTCTPINPAEIPATVGMILAQTLLPDLQRAYADPRIQADYQRWKAERAAKGGKENANR